MWPDRNGAIDFLLDSWRPSSASRLFAFGVWCPHAAVAGDGMTLLAMNGKPGPPLSISWASDSNTRGPDGDHDWLIPNRIHFANADGSVSPDRDPA